MLRFPTMNVPQNPQRKLAVPSYKPLCKQCGPRGNRLDSSPTVYLPSPPLLPLPSIPCSLSIKSCLTVKCLQISHGPLCPSSQTPVGSSDGILTGLHRSPAPPQHLVCYERSQTVSGNEHGEMQLGQRQSEEPRCGQMQYSALSDEGKV